MTNFQARAATVEEVARLAGLSPQNPFYTPQYAESQQILGAEGWIISPDSTGKDGCLAFMRSGRLGRSLVIPSTPDVETKQFWDDFHLFIKERGITELVLQTFSSTRVSVPQLPGELHRIGREEFHWDLRVPDLWSGLSTTHRRWIKKGTQNSLKVRVMRSIGALQDHVMLCDSSLERRRQRGETVFAGDHMFDEFSALLQSGAGELRQAIAVDDTIVSSILLIRSATGAYLVSAGTSEAGRAIGASHFLVYETARSLAGEEGEVFNLGGVRAEETGLRAYKAAFGAQAIPLESVVAAPGSRLRRSLITGVRTVVNAIRGRE